MDWKQFIRLDRAAGNLAVDSPPRGKRTSQALVVDREKAVWRCVGAKWPARR